MSLKLLRFRRTQQPKWGDTMTQHANGHAIHLQPKDVGTAGEIFLPLTYILAHYPHATVVIYPSDHFVSEEHRVLSAVDHALRGRDNTLVLAAKGHELRSLGCFPELVSPFERRSEAVDTVKELRVLKATDEAMPRRNFSSLLLHVASERLPERIADTLDKTGKPMACANEPLPFLYQG
jgi:hypothetical protein